MAKKKSKKKDNGKSKKADVKIEHFEMVHRVILSPAEVAERSDRAAHLMAERDQKDENHKAAAKHSKSEIETVEAKMRELLTQVRDKACYQPVKCERRYNYRTGTVTEVRTDTKEVTHERAMTAEERQLGFDLDPDAKEKDDKGLDDDFEDGEKPDGADKPADDEEPEAAE